MHQVGPGTEHNIMLRLSSVANMLDCYVAGRWLGVSKGKIKLQTFHSFSCLVFFCSHKSLKCTCSVFLLFWMVLVHFSNAGTSLYYEPGMLCGGDIEHSCNVQRSIGYYLEVLLCLAPFTKQMLRVTLTGVTSDGIDPSVSIPMGLC